MNEFFRQQFEEMELEYMPRIRSILLEHINLEFEGETPTDNATLKNWLLYLVENNRHDEVIIIDWLLSPTRHKRDADEGNNA